VRRLDSTLVLEAWEAAAGRPPFASTLALLAVVHPDRSVRELAALPVGRRDALLLDLHAAAFGPRLSGQARCDTCHEALAVDIAIETVRCRPPADDDGTAWTPVRHGDDELAFRCPDSDDLAAATEVDDDARSARTRLLERTVRATWRGRPISVDEVDPAAIAAVVEAMAVRDPQADVVLALVCPACGATTAVVLDVAALVWRRVETWARRVLTEVDVLARAYGWEERSVLALSEPRRQAYLELVR
jgi:hypothetical protein